jgi:hypothetical protein
MTDDVYARFGLPRPQHIGEAHRSSVELELGRLARALDAGDDGQAIGYLKCGIEALAKIVLDLDGSPADSNANFDSTVKGAHDLLAGQVGHELAPGTPFGNMATSARKIVVSMSNIRNTYGSGHGRARQPELTDEVLALAMDGTMLWLRWAFRRVDYFALGRPETLIRDLVGDPDGVAVFYSGDLAGRLVDANLPTADPRHVRAIGVAVGQRAARETFNVRIDGIDAPIADPDVERWPPAYRLGVARGLLFGPDERPTLTAHNLLQALEVCTPLTMSSTEINELLHRVFKSSRPGSLPGDPHTSADLLTYLDQHQQFRPPEEQNSWIMIGLHLRGVALAAG